MERKMLDKILYVIDNRRSSGSSVSAVSGYRMYNRAVEVRFPVEAKDFSSSLCVLTTSETHPASCTMGIGGVL
jgi:hypothetical protein